MTPLARSALIAVVGVIAVGGALYLIQPRLGPGSPSASPPAASPTPVRTAAPGPTDIVLVPATPLPDPAGTALAADHIGRRYAVNPPEILNDRQLVLTLRAADDPHCMAMFGGRSTCFTVLWDPVKPNDPGARGSARIVGGNLVISMDLVPNDLACVGSFATYAIQNAGKTLLGTDTPACTFPGFQELTVGSTTAVPTAFDTSTIGSDFALPMKVTLPGGWKVEHGIVGDIWFAHAGYPEGPDSTWWGPELLLVEEARIHDPSDVVSSVPATADSSRFVAWPADFVGYITALPGLTVVSGPEPITIGGVTGTQIVLMTPPMHPLVWLKDDFTWLGGGKTGVEPAMKRWFVVLQTGGHTLFMDFREDPAQFDARYAEFLPILESITF